MKFFKLTLKEFKNTVLNYFSENSILTPQAVRKALKFKLFKKQCYFTYNYDLYYIEYDNQSKMWYVFKHDDAKNQYYNYNLAPSIEKLLSWMQQYK